MILVIPVRDNISEQIESAINSKYQRPDRDMKLVPEKFSFGLLFQLFYVLIYILKIHIYLLYI